MILTNPRPNRFEEVKDEDYHLRYARWAIGSYSLAYYNDFVYRYMTNIAFYKGNQWIFDEDLDAFLMDESGEVRNRIKWIQNIIKPFVDYYRGAAIRMDLNTEVISMSRQSRNRRDDALDRLVFLHRTAGIMEQYNLKSAAEQLKAVNGLRNTEQETIESFNNLYVDKYTSIMSNLQKYISTVRNDIFKYKKTLATDIALSGLGVLKEVDFNGEQIWKRLAPERFIFDNTAEEDDFTDAEFQGEFEMASASDIYETNPALDLDTKKAIESSLITSKLTVGLHNILGFYMNYAQRSPVYKIYWRDTERKRYAAFYDRFGYPSLEEVTDKTPLNEAIPVEELVNMQEGFDWIKSILNKGRDKITTNNTIVDTDSVRYCHFLPLEYTNAGQDIVLKYGIRPYTPKNRLTYDKPDFPYKAATYSYVLGEILSPVDALISPQRFLNRVMSVAESHINNSRGSGTVIDKDSVDMQGGEEELQRNMNMSKPVYVRAQRQVNNVIGSYDATIKQGTLSLFDIANRMKSVANDVFGGGEAVTGGGGAYRATGSVNQANLSQGVIMQEPFFYALERIYMQAANSMVNRGKRIYLANKRQLSFVIGDEGVVSIELTDDMLLEDWNCKIIRSQDFYSERDAADQMLMVFRDKQMIDDKTFSSLYRNATLQDVAFGLRAYTGLKYEAQKEMAKVEEKNASIQLQQEKLASDMADAENNKELAIQQQIQADKNQAQIISRAMASQGRNSKEQ